MKSVLLIGIVLGIAMIGSAQTIGGGLGPTPGQVIQAPETTWGLVTNDATTDPDGIIRHAKGVEINIGTIRLTADEADFNRETGQMDLRGNVQMLTRPSR